MDGFGNITAKSAPAGSSEPTGTWAVDAATNRLTSVGSTAFYYGADGNTTGVAAFIYGYNIENQMVSATTGTSTERYSYDEGNRRIEKQLAGGSDNVYFYGPDGRLMAEFQNGVMVREWFYFGKLRVAQWESSVPAMLNESGTGLTEDRLGTVPATYPYGTDITTPPSGDDNPDFATYTKDTSTGLEYAVNRYYSAGFGRFARADQSGVAALGAPGSWNRYAYVEGDPINFGDPTGLYKKGDAGTGPPGGGLPPDIGPEPTGCNTDLLNNMVGDSGWQFPLLPIMMDPRCGTGLTGFSGDKDHRGGGGGGGGGGGFTASGNPRRDGVRSLIYSTDQDSLFTPQILDCIAGLESSWNPSAHNGSHNGMYQIDPTTWDDSDTDVPPSIRTESTMISDEGKGKRKCRGASTVRRRSLPR